MESTKTQQELMPKAEPQKEHLWLKKLVGKWTMEAEMQMQPGQPMEKSRGTETVRSLGDLWFVAEGTGEMPGGDAAEMIMTLGYDPAKGRYVGSWIGSMMTNMFVYDGELDASEKVLTLASEGPSMTDPEKTGRYKDVIEFRSDDHRVLTSHALDDDGNWQQFMTAHYRRTKR
jgi:hypothetical protein